MSKKEKELKISEEHLEKIRTQQSEKTKLVNNIGVVEVQKHDLLHALAGVMQQIRETAEEVEKEYGKISVNLEDGSFEVIKQEEQEVTEVAEEVKEEK